MEGALRLPALVCFGCQKTIGILDFVNKLRIQIRKTIIHNTVKGTKFQGMFDLDVLEIVYFSISTIIDNNQKYFLTLKIKQTIS